mgnify:CR=1 FL=1
MVVVITVVVTKVVELTGVEVINVGTKVVECSDVVTMVDKVTVVDLVVEGDIGKRVVVGLVDCDEVALVVELTNEGVVVCSGVVTI